MNDKLTIIVKPTQSGKTYKMLLSIISCFRTTNDDENSRRIQLIFVSNNILLAIQTATRVRDFELFEHDENEYLLFNSKSNTNTAGLEKVIYQLLDATRQRQVSNIIMCGNNTRFNDTEKLIKFILNLNRNISFDLWIDESDLIFSKEKHTKLTTNLCNLSNVKSITLLTATPGANLLQFGEINIVPLKSSVNLDTYSSWEDAQIIHINNDDDTIENAKLIIETYPQQFEIGVKCFIPADTYKDTHQAMASMLLDKGFAVLIINGTECTIYYYNYFKFDKKKRLVRELVKSNVSLFLSGYLPDKYQHNLRDSEVSEWIADLYVALELSNYPFAITGNLCISRGTTLSSKKMLINRAIMPPKVPKHLSTKELTLTRMYQLAGRVNGNTKEFDTWEPPIIFCSEIFDSCIKTMETRAKKLSEVAYDIGDNLVTSDIYENIAKAPMTSNEIAKKLNDEELELKGSVPEIIQITENEVNQLLNLRGTDKKDYLLGIITRLNPFLREELSVFENIKITQPGKENSENSRQKYIDAPVNKSANRIKWKVDIPKEANNKDVWLAFIDATDKRVIISIWYGSRLRQLN